MFFVCLDSEYNNKIKRIYDEFSKNFPHSYFHSVFTLLPYIFCKTVSSYREGGVGNIESILNGNIIEHCESNNKCVSFMDLSSPIIMNSGKSFPLKSYSYNFALDEAGWVNEIGRFELPEQTVDELFVVFPGFGMNEYHMAMYGIWLRSHGYNVIVTQGPFPKVKNADKILNEYIEKRFPKNNIHFMSFSLGSSSLLAFSEVLPPDKVVLIAPVTNFKSSYTQLKNSFRKRKWWARLIPDWYLDRVVIRFFEKNELTRSISLQNSLHSGSEILAIYGGDDEISTPHWLDYKDASTPSVSIIDDFGHVALSIPYKLIREPIGEFLYGK